MATTGLASAQKIVRREEESGQGPAPAALVSAASVRETLKNLISNEPLNQPLSDEILVSKLQTEGINLARRTVAKYRELMNIPASYERRKMMKIQSIHL